MTDSTEIKKDFSYMPVGKPVRIEAHKKMPGGVIVATRFKVEEIAELEKTGDAITTIVLSSGTRIPVTMPVLELEDLIDRTKAPDGTIDLREKSGSYAEKFILQQEFNSKSAGDLLSDGSIFIGNIRGHFWMAAKENYKHGTREFFTFAEAQTAAKDADILGYHDWELPDNDVLQEMLQNKDMGAFKNTFSDTWYWSGQKNPDNTAQGFQGKATENGKILSYDLDDKINVRFVRRLTPDI